MESKWAIYETMQIKDYVEKIAHRGLWMSIRLFLYMNVTMDQCCISYESMVWIMMNHYSKLWINRLCCKIIPFYYDSVLTKYKIKKSHFNCSNFDKNEKAYCKYM